MMQLFTQSKLIFIGLLLFASQSTTAAYNGSQAYNHSKSFNLQVNAATGTLSFSYPLIASAGGAHAAESEPDLQF